MDAADAKLVEEVREWLVQDKPPSVHSTWRLLSIIDALSARLALAEDVIESARPFRLAHWRGPMTPTDGVAYCTQDLDAKLKAYDSAKGTVQCNDGSLPSVGATPTPSSEPAPRMVTLLKARGWMEDMRERAHDLVLEQATGTAITFSAALKLACAAISGMALPRSFLAALQARVETTLNAEHFDPDRRERSSPLPPLVEDCSTGTPKMVPAPEPPAQYVMPPRCTAMREEVRCASAAGHPGYHANADLSVTWIDSVKTEAERMAREVQAENDYIAGPLSDWNSQPAHVCAHPGVMRRSEWLTSSGGVPARIYCQSCGQTLYPPAAPPAVPAEPVITVSAPSVKTVDGRLYTRSEVDALLAGLRERIRSRFYHEIGSIALSELRAPGAERLEERARSRRCFTAAVVMIEHILLWPVTEPERKE